MNLARDLFKIRTIGLSDYQVRYASRPASRLFQDYDGLYSV